MNGEPFVIEHSLSQGVLSIRTDLTTFSYLLYAKTTSILNKI